LIFLLFQVSETTSTLIPTKLIRDFDINDEQKIESLTPFGDTAIADNFLFCEQKIRLLHNDYNIMNFRVLFFTDGEDTKSSKEEKERIKKLFYNNYYKKVNLFFHQIAFTSDSSRTEKEPPAKENFLFQEYLPNKDDMPNMTWYKSSCNTKTEEVMRELMEKNKHHRDIIDGLRNAAEKKETEEKVKALIEPKDISFKKNLADKLPDVGYTPKMYCKKKNQIKIRK